MQTTNSGYLYLLLVFLQKLPDDGKGPAISLFFTAWAAKNSSPSEEDRALGPSHCT